MTQKQTTTKNLMLAPYGSQDVKGHLPVLRRISTTLVPSNPIPNFLQHKHEKQSTTQTNAATRHFKPATRTALLETIVARSGARI